MCDICNNKIKVSENFRENEPCNHLWELNHHANIEHPHWMMDVCRICLEERQGTTQAYWNWEYGKWYFHDNTDHERTLYCDFEGCSSTEKEFANHDTTGRDEYIEDGYVKKQCNVCDGGVIIRKALPPKIVAVTIDTITETSCRLSATIEETYDYVKWYIDGSKVGDGDTCNIGGLINGKIYTVKCVVGNIIGTDEKIEIFNTLFEEYKWNKFGGGGSGSQGRFLVGDECEMLTSCLWNDFVSVISTKYKAVNGGEPSEKPYVGFHDEITAVVYNSVLSILRGFARGVPSEVTPYDYIEAESHINAIMDVFNLYRNE